MAVAFLRLRADGGAGETLSFTDELTLGRETIKQSRDTDARLSRRHARVCVKADGQLWVEDLASTNGTFVNGKRIGEPQQLKFGDEITVGRTTLEVVAAAAGEMTIEDRRQIARACRRVRAPSLLTRWRENRERRRALPPFPNYTQIPSMLSIRAWWVVRATSVVATLVVVALCFADPATGLRIVWGIGIPLLPILFFVAPGLWRDICPLAASNQTPRVMGWTRALEAPAWLKRYGYLISITLFIVFITLRKVGLQTNGPGSGGLLLLALLSGFTGGMFLKGKSGWCSSICPLLPVQRIYGQTPFALVGNSHCQPCVGCTKNCYDFNPKVAYLADLSDEDPEWYAGRKAFAAAFPGLILGFFKVADVPANSLGAMYWAAGALRRRQRAGVRRRGRVAAGRPAQADHLVGRSGAEHLLLVRISRDLQGDHRRLGPGGRHVDRAGHRLRADRDLGCPHLSQRTGVCREGRCSQALGRRGGAVDRRPLGSETRPAEDHLSSGRSTDRHRAGRNAAGGRRVKRAADRGRVPDGRVRCRPGGDRLRDANISEIGDDERATLERLGLAQNTRMACCCRVKGPVSVSLKPEQAREPTPSQLLRLDFNRAVERVVVIGNGIAGITAADYVRRNHPECSVDIVAGETHQLYNRMAITRLLYGGPDAGTVPEPRAMVPVALDH